MFLLTVRIRATFFQGRSMDFITWIESELPNGSVKGNLSQREREREII
jgi:hypothetical protein